MAKKLLHLALAQINPVVGGLTYNAAKIKQAWESAPENCDLIVLPELAVCGYMPEDLILKPFFIEEVETTVRALLRESKSFAPALLLPAPWKDGGKIYNAVHLIHNGRILATRTKHRLPNYGVFDEMRVFAPGPLPEPVEFKGIKLGVMICEDMWYPDVAAHLKKKGAEILIVTNGSPYDMRNRGMRFEQAKARVRETQLPLAYVNQVGGQDELVFDGMSFVLNSDGKTLLQGAEFEEGFYNAVMEKDKGPWLLAAEDIVPAYEGLEAVYQALMLGLRDYISKNGFPGVILGMSGGIDSALSAAIAVDALGPEAVHCVMMPSEFTSQDSLDDAAVMAANIGAHLDTIPITQTVKSFNDVLQHHFSAGTPSTTFENIQPRSRGIILMALSNATGNMVLSTGNKSEMAVGYATLYGDMCGGFNVLKDIYKTQVYELAKWRNSHKPKGALGPGGIIIPDRIITKAPTAELKPNQTDQDTLPPYAILDDILACLIEQDMDVSAIVRRGHDRQTVQKVWKMLDAAEYKRRQAPPGIKITSRAFGRDRRYPITNHFVNIIEKQ